MFDGCSFPPERSWQDREPETGHLSVQTAILLTLGLIATVCLIVLFLDWARVPVGCTNPDDLFAQSPGLLG